MGLLSRIDEVYLLAILELKDNAYGVPRVHPPRRRGT